MYAHLSAHIIAHPYTYQCTCPTLPSQPDVTQHTERKQCTQKLEEVNQNQGGTGENKTEIFGEQYHEIEFGQAFD